jgi:hypothetical protein
MSGLMSIEDIKAQFDDEWVLVGEPDVEENLQVKSGTVLWHGKDRDELHRKIEDLQSPFNIAVLYTGITPEDAVIIL